MATGSPSPQPTPSPSPAPQAAPQTANTVPPAGSAEAASAKRELERYKEEIREAQELLDFAIAESAPAREGPVVVSDTIVAAVKEAEQQLLTEQLPPADIRTKFEAAYRDLAQLVAPVTARTLHDTKGPIVDGKRRLSPAGRWSMRLWMITIVFLGWIAVTETLERALIQLPIEEETAPGLIALAIASQVLTSLNRFVYGALGACAYLLRSLHTYIYRREFNSDRIPEYLSRILLGVVSGGAISLFVNQLTTEDGVVTLSEAALAFLAGYNSDFLFRVIERVVEAIIPKVGIESVKRAPPAVVTASVSLQDLLDRLNAATTEGDKALLRELINKVKERM